MVKISKGIRWGLLWFVLVATLVLLDAFVFTADAEQRSHAMIDPVATDDPSQKLTITWLGPPYFAGAREGLWVETMLEERFNIELKPLFLDPTAYQRKKPLIISGGPAPDVIWEADTLSLQSSVRHGFAAEIPLELIQRRMPTYFRELTEEAPDAWLLSVVKGHNYGIPTFSPEGDRPKPGVWRMDWLRNVGIERAPETIEEFHEALRRFTFNDPDRNGIDDTYGMSGDISNWWWVAFSEIFGAWGVIPFDWQEVDGQVVWGGVRPETRTVLQLLADWYREGIIHPDFVTDNMLVGQSLDRKFLSGRIGYLYYRGEYSNMNPRSSGSFYSKLINLQFESILAASDDLFPRLIRRVPHALGDQLIAQEMLIRLEEVPTSVRNKVMASLEDRIRDFGPDSPLLEARLSEAASILDDVPGNVRNWMIKVILPQILTRAHFHEESFKAAALVDASTALEDDQTFNRLLYAILHDEILGSIRAGYSGELFDEFEQFVASRWSPEMTAVLNGNWPEAHGERIRLIRRLSEGDEDAVVADAWEWLLNRGAITAVPDLDALAPLVIAHYATLLNATPEMTTAAAEPVLVPAPFPVGPNGQRGARTWGKSSNIITFGRHIAERPEVALRTMDMLETIYSDRVLSREANAGREGIHWFWADPVLGVEAGEGAPFNPEYVDPDTGQVVDLSQGMAAFRRVLDARLGFFNLVGRASEYRLEFETARSQAFLETWQREEWGISNALGKSDIVPSAERYLGDLRKKQQTIFAEIIRGSRPIEAFDEFVANWYATGGQVLTDEANQALVAKKELLQKVRALIENE